MPRLGYEGIERMSRRIEQLREAYGVLERFDEHKKLRDLVRGARRPRLKVRKPWKAIGITRANWYRRRALGMLT